MELARLLATLPLGGHAPPLHGSSLEGRAQPAPQRLPASCGRSACGPWALPGDALHQMPRESGFLGFAAGERRAGPRGPHDLREAPGGGTTDRPRWARGGGAGRSRAPRQSWREARPVWLRDQEGSRQASGHKSHWPEAAGDGVASGQAFSPDPTAMALGGRQQTGGEGGFVGLYVLTLGTRVFSTEDRGNETARWWPGPPRPRARGDTGLPGFRSCPARHLPGAPCAV